MALFGWGSKKRRQELPETLHFKGTKEAFTYACEFMSSEIRERQALVALIQDASKEADAVQVLIESFESKRDQNVFDTYRLHVSGSNGGFSAVGVCYKRGLNLQPGSLVYWVPMERDPMLTMMAQDKRSAWIGGIVAKLEPSFSMRDGWVIAERFTN